jgi:hypothetical protein
VGRESECKIREERIEDAVEEGVEEDDGSVEVGVRLTASG